jgi:hypothetical protein
VIENLHLAMTRGRLGIDVEGNVHLFDTKAAYNPGWFDNDWIDLTPEQQATVEQMWNAITPEDQAFYLDGAKKPMPNLELRVEKMGGSYFISLGNYEIQVSADEKGGEGILVVNRSKKTRCIYKKDGDRDTLLFSDAEGKGCWKEFSPL